MTRKKRRHSPEQIVKKLRDADAMEAAGKSIAEVLQSLEVSEATLNRWRNWNAPVFDPGVMRVRVG